MVKCLKLKKSNCKSCFRCVRKCPVKAIRFSEDQAHIIGNECILCGNCVVQCPQNAKEIADGIEKVKTFLQSEDPVVVSLAPSFVANYDGIGIESMRQALKKLGFFDVEETAIGATIVKNEYERILKEEDHDVLISSCCHSINLLIQNRFPECIKYLADVISPMQAHCKDIKARIPNAKTVFIGPCIAKKDEAEYYEGIVDAVLTFEELDNMLSSENIELEFKTDSNENSRARFFPTTGGVLKTMAQDTPGYTYLAIDGVANCLTALRDISNGKIHKCFIEMSACIGSCIGGPMINKTQKPRVGDYLTVSNYAGTRDFEVAQPESANLKKNFIAIENDISEPSEAEIKEVFYKMGKINPTDEVNCGACGYNSCRDKAIAIIRGKADPSMCLAYLKDKAESFSDTIVRNTPNGVILLDDNLKIQRMNNVARRILGFCAESEVLGQHISNILDPALFIHVQETGQRIKKRRTYLPEYKKHVDQTIVYDVVSHLFVGIIQDVTDEIMEREKKESISKQTVEVADKVVEKQMRIVQEIASLLGETAAETKIALTKLKESIDNE